ncbi:MAG: HTTM domain-containing protein, partial [Mangrovimonas sp.]|nr:HTTM domain-containing protein [Mangrovimonas sp.]
RAKHGLATYIVVDKNSGKQDTIRLENYLTPKQIRSASTKPDVIWQFA